MTRVTVVVPSWNDAVLLQRCLAALAVQSRPADAVIVVDNASTDATASIARSAGATVVHERVRGVARATATGFDAAVGADPQADDHGIVMRLDADSLPPPDWIERMLAVFERSARIDAVSGPGAFTDGGPVLRWIGRRVYIGGYFWSMRLLLGHWPVFGSNCALRATLWRDIRTRVHSDVRRVHDDLDMSFAFRPGTVIVYEPSLVVGISPRPFDSVGGLGRRLWWAVTTARLNRRQESLWRRRRRWRRARADRGTADAGSSRTARDQTGTPPGGHR